MRYRRLIPDCETAQYMLSQSQDCMLPLVQRVRLNAHLAICPACRSFSRQLDVMRTAMQGMQADDEGERDGPGSPSQPE